MLDRGLFIGSIVVVMTHPHEKAGFQSVIRPAIVTEVYSDTDVALQVFYKHGVQAWDHVLYSSAHLPGYWFWPSMVT